LMISFQSCSKAMVMPFCFVAVLFAGSA